MERLYPDELAREEIENAEKAFSDWLCLTWLIELMGSIHSNSFGNG